MEKPLESNAFLQLLFFFLTYELRQNSMVTFEIDA